MAEFLHHSDKRKIVNAIFAFFKSLSLSPDGTVVYQDLITQPSVLRFLPILVWIQAEKAILEKRIAKRIQSMVHETQEEGMSGLDEAMFVLEKFKGDHDFTKGVLQAIGYKEFFDYYSSS